MIKQATAAAIERLPQNSEAAVKIRALYEAYGIERSFLRLYEAGASCIALFEGTALAAILPTEYEETAAFLHMTPDIHSIRTTAEYAAYIASSWKTEATQGITMTTQSPMKSPIIATLAPPLKAVYGTLCMVFPEQLAAFDVWYADTHHRQRHNLLRVAAVLDNDVVAACALTTAETPQAVLIGGVATLPTYRGRGYAHACVAALTNQAHASQQRVLISPKHDGVVGLYEHWGFTKWGDWGQIQ